MSTSKTMRVLHRYLGFFLVGIMAVYAMSGTVLIFRTTDFLKVEKTVERSIQPGLQGEALGRELKIRGLKITEQTGDVLTFEQGTYNQATGEAAYTVKELPLLLDKMTHLHKANTNHPLFWLNIFFGASLLFFVVSSFWMFRPKTSIFKKGMYWTIGGMVLTIILLWV